MSIDLTPAPHLYETGLKSEERYIYIDVYKFSGLSKNNKDRDAEPVEASIHSDF
jgi:hypothetical protein